MLFDAHAHFSDEKYDDCRDALADEIRAAGIKYVMDAGSDLESSFKAAAISEMYDFCYAAAGCHPHEAESFSAGQLALIGSLYKERAKVKAIGEIGLDYHYDNSERDLQKYWFRRQLDLALELKAPVVIHEREAFSDCMDILKAAGAFSEERTSAFPKKPDGSCDARVMFHCFSGSAESAKELVKLGATLGICGPVTYKNNKKTVEVAASIPLVHLTVETDSPYLTPVPLRGQINKPQYVLHTANKLADIKGLPPHEVYSATFEKACRFFDI